MRPVFVPALVLFLSGCGTAELPSGDSANPPESEPLVSQPQSPANVEPLIEIAPEAKEQMRKVAAAANPGKQWWLRISVKYGGCTGMTTPLEIDTEGSEPGDTEFRCGEIRCLIATTQTFLIQGGHIAWIQNEKETGFKVTFPNRTAENMKRWVKWMAQDTDAMRARIENQSK